MPQAQARRPGKGQAPGEAAVSSEWAHRRPSVRKRTKVEALLLRAPARVTASSLGLRWSSCPPGIADCGRGVRLDGSPVLCLPGRRHRWAQHRTPRGLPGAGSTSKTSSGRSCAVAASPPDGVKTNYVAAPPHGGDHRGRGAPARGAVASVTQERDWWLDEEGVVLPYHGDAQAGRNALCHRRDPREDYGQSIQPEGIVASVIQLATALPGIDFTTMQSEGCHKRGTVGNGRCGQQPDLTTRSRSR